MPNRQTLMLKTLMIAASLLGAGLASAQTAAVAQDVQRNVNQEQRIENGLQSGSLSTREAASLQKQTARVDRMESHALANGSVSPREQASIQRAENNVSRDISRDTHNGISGNPASLSSQRMQADVQRNINQEQRIQNGVANGSLTNREAGKLERGQAHVDRREARAGANGHVGAAEQRGIQRAENRDSRAIYHDKHNGRVRG
ncbi:hypothetical protein CF70_008250 [Cupriavidus sp. SK-3]|uniref:hypothetical protein n=1 Tax=Cupriavidus sp. SK-3 TaxID=1470558 RepID=UPI000449343B|nr:hypothetical protein [Cupriavidus sp. SK-3]KDP86291.1 hypothetical protein CF70_008250 [Cupriavidus sp. SK-3]